MPLHDTEAQEIETSTAAESLPDPTLVNGRTHELTNTGTVTAVWSSVGATPFTEGGVNVATISVPRGDSKQFQSDGTHWVAKSKAGSRAIFAGTGVSDASGNVTFTFPVGMFSVAPVAVHAVQTGITDVTECRISAISAASVTFNVRRSPSVVILGISVLQVPVPASGVTVHCVAMTAGSTP